MTATQTILSTTLTCLLGLALPATGFAHCGACGATSDDKAHAHCDSCTSEVKAEKTDKACACKGDKAATKTHGHDHAHDIVDTAVADGRFSVLASAVTKAGLVDALKGEGPLTVFAPTDEAFSKLPEGTLESLTDEQLVKILKSHVVAGKIKAKQAVAAAGTSVEALSGAKLPVTVDGDKVMIAGSTVIVADVKATNGIIHAIDTVIIPE